MRRLIYRYFPALLPTLNIFRSYIFEARRFARFNTNNRYRGLKTKHRAILVRKCHGLEKAFSLPSMKEVFGKKQAEVLLDEVKVYVELYGVEREVLDGLKILDSYFIYHEGVNDVEIERLSDCFKKLLIQLDISKNAVSEDCFRTLKGRHSLTGESFDEFFLSRYSIRAFTDVFIPKDDVLKCGFIAGKSPSACNRQPWNLRIVQSRELIQKALKLQNGNRGFNEVISNLAIVTGKISNFSSKERNQVYIDCGLYSMSFMLALHARGIGSCPLNMSYQSSDEKMLIQSLGFEADEVPIMMIAFGFAEKDAKVANSQRKLPEEFIQFDNI